MSDAANPYQPPKADLGSGPEALEVEALPDAGMGARLLNFVLDSVVVLVLGMICGVVLVFALGADAVSSDLVSNAVGFGVMIFYYVTFEAAFGWTVGKLATGTRVVRIEGGGKPNVLQIIGRTAARFIPFEPFSMLGGSAWHDGLSRTRVVRVRR